MQVGIVFLRIYDRNRRHVYHYFDGCGTLQHMYGAAHAHQDWSDEFAASNLGHQFCCNVGGSEVGEDQDIRATLQRTEWVELFDDLGGESFVGHDFSV